MSQLSRLIKKIRSKAQEITTSPGEMESFIEEGISFHCIPDRIPTSGKSLAILCVMMTYDYGKRKQGYSYEENNFFHSLLHMGHRLIKFDFMELIERFGRKVMNRMLYEVALRYDPDLLFAVLYTDQLDKHIVSKISTELRTITFNWFCDDHWKFDEYSKYWAPCFNWVSTTDKQSINKYRDIGYSNVIYTQWGCNHYLYRKLPLGKVYDVTFIGQPHGNRKEIISRLKSAGIKVQAWGKGWPEGRVSQGEMIRIFNQSKINLNLSNASTGTLNQIKGRDFEVPGCGGFLITANSNNIHNYYKIDEEIVCYQDIDDLIDKIRYYLAHESIREKIAHTGYERVLKDHTYDNRLSAIFETKGLPNRSRTAL